MSERDTRFDYFDACMKQSELAHQSFDGRQQIEWKVAFGFWTLVALTTYNLPERYPLRWIISAALAAFILYAWWLCGMWGANEKDKQCRAYFRDEAEKFLLCPSHRLEKKFKIDNSKLKIWPFLKTWSVLPHLMVTLLLLIAFCFLAGRIGQNQQRRSTETETGQFNSLAMSTAKASAEAARSAAEAAKSASEVAKLASEIAKASLQAR